MSDTVITIIAIFVAAILMFIFPLMTLADRNDDIAQLTVQAETTEFVDEIRRTGKLTQDEYNTFIEIALLCAIAMLSPHLTLLW